MLDIGGAVLILSSADCENTKVECETENSQQFALLLAEASREFNNNRGRATRKMTPQCKLILEHLKQGNTITQRSALLDFGVMSLPRRIADLKQHHNINIKSTMEHNKITGQRYARYSLEKAA